MKAECQFDLRNAIASGRLDLHFQPRVCAAGNRVIGAEALLRWSPTGTHWSGIQALSSLSSEDFALLWRWKLVRLKQVFLQLRSHGWLPANGDPGFVVSLNLSQKQLANNVWADELVALVDEGTVPGGAIEVELTEQGAPFDHVAAASAFEYLRSAGIRIALDDFPEGGASFLLLSQFRFDKVKIDRCMVPGVDEDVGIWLRKRQLLEDLLHIITRSGAAPVLEGVEQPIQHRFLSNLAISEWQGYLWGKPMPFSSLVDRLSFVPAHMRTVAPLSSG